MLPKTSNHLAFLVDSPLPGKFMMFPDWFENIPQDILDLLEEIDKDEVFKVRWDAELAKSKYKVFKLKINE